MITVAGFTFTADDIVKLAIGIGTLVYSILASTRSKKQLKAGAADASALRSKFEELKTTNNDIMAAYLTALAELEKLNRPGRHTPDPAVIVGSVTGQTPRQPAPLKPDDPNPSTTAIEGLLGGD